MKKKKDFSKFTKRSVHKRRAKEKAKQDIIRAVSDSGVGYDALKFRDVIDKSKNHRSYVGDRSDDIVCRGIYCGSKSNFGFVSPEDGGDDIFIPGGNCRGAIDGDFVEIVYHKYINREGETKTEGRVTKVLEIGRRTIIGTLCEEIARHGRRVMYRVYVQPDDPKIALWPMVNDAMGACIGDKVEALIKRDGTSHPDCDIVRIFGDTESFEANYSAILAECGIVTEFTPDELSLADKISREPLSLDGREDLRGETIFTIDGAGAKDLDDAVSLRRLPGGGWRLGVHIADVSHYVCEKTPLDRCVMQRGTSVYFTDKVVPMLPEALSNGACSLNADEDKYALSAFITLDKEGDITDLRLCESVIRSKLRGVYSEVNDLISGNATPQIKKKYSKVRETLVKMEELYRILYEKSQKRGSIDFDSDESVIILGEDGSPISIEKRQRGVSERIIEQFMLTANEAVATCLSERNIPCVYRVHEAPPADAFSDFLGYLDSLGFDTRDLRRGDPDAKKLSSLLDLAEEKGMGEAVSYTMLRSMAKAKYSDVKSSHFGLGIENYCHFTSPIRRLSDLATHRIIKKVLFDNKNPKYYASYARRAAVAATEGELRAISAERKIDDLYKVIYMSEKEGECFEGRITSITSFGLFCMLDNTCEGLVPISEMPGVFSFDERNLTMRSRDLTFHIADRVTLRLEEANITRGKLRFSLVDYN